MVKVGTREYCADDSGKRKAYSGLTEMWGTPTHYAPELIDREYGPQADMWSLGCVIYEMLTGHEAYPSKEGMERKDLYANIKAARYDKRRLGELGISADAQDLLAKIFHPDPHTSLSASEALKHPWVSGEGHTEHHRMQRLGSVYEMFHRHPGGSSGDGHDGDGDDSTSKKRGKLGVFTYLFGSPQSSRRIVGK